MIINEILNLYEPGSITDILRQEAVLPLVWGYQSVLKKLIKSMGYWTIRKHGIRVFTENGVSKGGKGIRV